MGKSESKEEWEGEMRFVVFWAGGRGGAEVLGFLFYLPRNVLLAFVESLVNILMRLSLERLGFFRSREVYFGDRAVRRSLFWVWFLEQEFDRSVWFRASRIFC